MLKNISKSDGHGEIKKNKAKNIQINKQKL